jgi:glutamate/tyrosine decarboxylase-like PLP-dependent enzyme
MEPEAIRELGYRIVDMISEEFAEPEKRPVFPAAQSRAAMEARFGGPLPRTGVAPEDLLTTVRDHLLPAAGNPNHPGLMAYVLTASTPFAALMEALVAAIKLRPTTWKNQPASCHIETTVGRWLGQMVGFAEDAAGYITTGGSWANLVGLATARGQRAGWDIRTEGVANHPPLVAYVSAEAHSCIDRSAELLGMGNQGLRKIPVDADFRICLDRLETTIEHDLDTGHQPFCVIGNAGTVNTGAIDPLTDLADIAERYGLWFHVDGAYGALATLAPEARPLFAGIERADSLTLDPHKWLNTPFEAGCILTKDWAALGDTFSLIPPYLRGAMGEEHNQYEYGFELSRTDRALKIWLVLQQYGVDHYAELISQHLALACHLAALVREADDFELLSAPVLSICCFRFVPPDLKACTEQSAAYLNDLNHAIEMALARDGRALVSGTELNGVRVLRACIASHPTTQASVEEAFTLLREYGHALHAEHRGKRV